jgi:hypothetical protein
VRKRFDSVLKASSLRRATNEFLLDLESSKSALPEREGRNPANGEVIKIAASKKPFARQGSEGTS